ncbi:TetR/AcrR family transcriptional regulator [Corynebacterium sp. HS2168-gen11]|uniref:TetR/AcrR family transcriptional regulator n=1 Tax=Corynebacterium sp. HS2168-gen11 TaxID=2974027 RepID=UPI00216B5B7A|nr:TetR family transcriptional regulator [Corynebacterium sp. HS2168-gen11]MCS4535325.1 TetR family transcriptional regulator [Corynebacterium sp. HS2168-gen11]
MTEDLHVTTDPSPETVLAIAVRRFSEGGFHDTKLETIAKESGMSKRMIHYHFGDKKGLYISALAEAVRRLRPTVQELELESAVPVEGVRKVVEAVFKRYNLHPEAVRLLSLESMMNYTNVAEQSPLMDQSAITLQLDKLLMLGQDAGAFRPGISAQDVFTLIASLAVFRVTAHKTTINLYNIDMLDDANTRSMARMAADSVLAFLTSHIRVPEQISYISTIPDTESVHVIADHYESGEATYNFDTDIFE